MPVIRIQIWCAILLVTLTAKANAQDLWQSQNIYQIITDRFFNGDVSNDNADGNYNGAAGGGVHGGDFKGIEQKLDYIKALGATAIWISPVVKNVNGDYHGYAGSDFYNVDPHWGGLADLQHLIQTAHSKGLLVIDDVVVNHGSQLLNSNDSGYPNFKNPPAGYNLFYRDNSKQYAPPFDPSSGQVLTALFHNNGFIQDFTNTTQVQMGFLEGLDDFRTESSYVQTNMANIYKFWLEQGFDGFRVDTVKHVDQGFWQTWCPQIHADAGSHGAPNFFMFGEVYDSSETKNASYTGTVNGPNFELDSVLDYPLYFSINSVFASQTGNTKQIQDHYAAVDANYDSSAKMRLVTFLDNHDQPRFLNPVNANNNLARLQVALAFLYTARGIPCLYYGTEQAFNGGADPNNREDMFAGQFEQGPSLGDNFNEVHPLFQFIAKLNNFRRLYPALRNGSHVNLWNDANGPGLFAYSRVLGSQEVFVVFNTSAVSQNVPSRPSTYPAGTVLVNLLDPQETITITSTGQTPFVQVFPTTAKIFIAQSQFMSLDPVITGIQPAHDAQSVPTPSSIVIQFSQAMNTASVQAAFSTVPATSGVFSWSSGNTQMTYQATGGLPPLTTLAVHIALTAATIDGRTLYAPFDARFTTAAQSVQDITPPTISIFAPQNGASESGFFQVNGLASDDTKMAAVQVGLDGGDWVTQGASTGPNQQYGWTQSYTPGYHMNGWHTVTARAIDAAGNTSQTVSLQVRFVGMPPSYYLEDIFPEKNSSSVSDCSGTYWLPDQPYSPGIERSYGYIGGNKAQSTNQIIGVCNQAQVLYQSQRFSSPNADFQYVFSCPTGVYQVTILDTETMMTAPNQRRFDVYAQGQKVLPDFDIYQAAGGANLPVSETFTTTVSNGLLTVDFKPLLDSAIISAIGVKKIGDVFSDGDGIADWWRLAYFGHATGLASDQSRAGDDPLNSGMTNLQQFVANTDPLNPATLFRVLLVQESGGSMEVQIEAAPSRTYQLQRSPSLTNPSWQTIETWTTPDYFPHGGLPLFDPNASTLTSPQFYRVIIAQ